MAHSSLPVAFVSPRPLRLSRTRDRWVAWLYAIAAVMAIVSAPAAACEEASVPNIQTETFSKIADFQVDENTLAGEVVFHLKSNSSVLVIVFPDLASQGRMLNRIAALVEKKGAPRDRILSAPELGVLIEASGLTPETFYYGHDYRMADINRFFALAVTSQTALNPAEDRLRCLLSSSGQFAETESLALVSVAASPGHPAIDTARRAILRHEVSHGEFLTNTRYRDYCLGFWAQLAEPVRQVFIDELSELGYDRTQTFLIVNEMQAFLWEQVAGALIDVRLRRLRTSLATLRHAFLEGIDRSPRPITSLFADDGVRQVYLSGVPARGGLNKIGIERGFPDGPALERRGTSGVIN